MDLRLLENILSIAEEKSITKAAERCFITQSALNQQLQKLEEELGTPLFIRSRSNWLPTEAGKVYLETARKMLLLKQDAYHRIADYAEQNRRSLTVGLIPERGVDMFTAVYPEFHRTFPAMQVEPIECHVTAMQRLITSGQLHLGLATLTEDQQDDNIYHLMAEEEIVLAAPASHSLAAQGSKNFRCASETDLAQFRDDPFVRIYQRSTLFHVTEPLFQAAGFSPRVLFSTSSNVSKFRIVASGLGCALLPAVYAVPDDKVRYFRLHQHPVWHIMLCSRKGGFFGKPEAYYLELCRNYWKDKLAAYDSSKSNISRISSSTFISSSLNPEIKSSVESV